MKEYFDHYTGLKAAKDGEVYVPMTKGHSGHFTYGNKKNSGHRCVRYKGKEYFVHVLVAEVFLNDNKPIDGKIFHVHHINEDPEDNRVENLVILSHKQHRALHAIGKHFSMETRRKMSEVRKGKCVGANSPCSKPIIGVHKETGEEVKFSGTREAQRVLGIHQSSISKCCLGKVKSAGGYIWRYEKAPENSGASY